MDKTIAGYRVVRQYTVDDAETEHAVNIDGTMIPFGYCNPNGAHCSLKCRMATNFGWHRPPMKNWDALMGFEGILLVRGDSVVDSFVTKMN